jgi:glycosyltransferase involved in cell wall biosynthesis
LAGAATLGKEANQPVVEWPFVSVVIPVKNDRDRLDCCLCSLAEQEYVCSRYEIIVVDNGSTDGSDEVARRHGVTLLIHPDLRVGALRNRGIAQSRGQILAFVDSDHETPPDWLTRGVQRLLADSGVCVVGAHYAAPLQGTWVQNTWEKHRLRVRDCRETRWLGAGNMFLRREDFDRVGGFREDLVAAEDVDLCVRLAQHGKIINDPEIYNIHHGEPKTLAAFFWKEYWRGSSGVRAFFHQGMPLSELPSLMYPLYHLLLLAIIPLALVFSLLQHDGRYLGLTVLAAVLPAIVLAAQTCWLRRELAPFLPLIPLYLTYGWARAFALFKP